LRAYGKSKGKIEIELEWGEDVVAETAKEESVPVEGSSTEPLA
jgi:hypothetical protein